MINSIISSFSSLITEVSVISYNRPIVSPDLAWNPVGTTIGNQSIAGLNPIDIVIDGSNTIYIPHENQGIIRVFLGVNSTLVKSITANSTNLSSLFVLTSDEIYFSSINGVTEMKSNMTNSILRMDLCVRCIDIFLTLNQTLYCSLSDQHQIIAKSLPDEWSYLLTVAGTGDLGSTSATLRNPRGIFLDENNSTLFVADCGNNRVVRQSSNQLNQPSSLSFDSFGNIFVIDRNNHRIQKFSLFNCSDQWAATVNMNVQRYKHAACVLSNGKVLVTGGWKGGALKSVELYDPSTGSWSNTPNMNVGRYYHTALLLSNGKLLVAGGQIVSSAELYSPLTGIWTMTGNMNYERHYHTASILSNEKVLLAAGDDSGGHLKTAELY
ncbi:unnamed protein product [Adineta ricciae]|uniref:Uncharacterized protein n=1 Tax=Adineta ricciae TaxID=249248 RepID=A0A815U6D6_ADIRI|nr:unnamed protein product [Adineta ricciae]CAF1512529.1 unnamed protein product [Adineta ricciae]